MRELGLRTLDLGDQDYIFWPDIVVGSVLNQTIPFPSANPPLLEKNFERLMQTNVGKYMKAWAENNGFNIVCRGHSLALQVDKELDLCMCFHNFDEMSGWIRGLHEGRDFVLNGDKMVISEQRRKEVIKFIEANSFHD